MTIADSLHFTAWTDVGMHVNEKFMHVSLHLVDVCLAVLYALVFIKLIAVNW